MNTLQQRDLPKYIDYINFKLTTSNFLLEEKFLEDYVGIEEGSLFVLPKFGIRKDFTSLNDVRNYFAEKFDTVNVEVEEKYEEDEDSQFLKKVIYVKINGKNLVSLVVK